MIVPMKHLTLLCVAADQSAAMERLRALGTVHLALRPSDSEAFRTEAARYDALHRAEELLASLKEEKPESRQAEAEAIDPARFEKPLPELENRPFDEQLQAVLALGDELQACRTAQALLRAEENRYAPFGSFDPALAGTLAAQGLPVTLFALPLTTPPAPAGQDGTSMIQILTADAHQAYGVAVGPVELPESAKRFPLPERSLDASAKLLETVERRGQAITARLESATAFKADLDQALARQQDRVAFAQAVDTMEKQGAIAWITGWIPAPQVNALQEAARAASWGILLRDPEGDEQPPTLMRPPKLFRPVLTLFEALGISPAYAEADVSIPFYLFFSIFFAMLVGDGGYGAIILALVVWARMKMRKAPASPFILLGVFAVATIIWGFLSNTWFGVSPKCLDNPVARWLADPSYKNMMLLCFTLGVTHLVIARLWNAVNLFPDSKWLAQLGWAGIVAFMYCMTCSVVGIFPCPTFMYGVMAVSLILVFGFSLKRSELKEHGIELGMMPLTIAGTLGDIISYVRLFAVGLASVKVAQNFNEMALGLGLPVWAKIIPLVLILLIGHGLNFAMAALSILVHAVRLNTLEFSNHKGISWSGYAYRPFRKQAKAD
ncbi:MAG: hypothetical protein J6334_12935 [Kiritimatiellae bacterium]|nr:hypothetical protein [Kiritimatiellia bacterium]